MKKTNKMILLLLISALSVGMLIACSPKEEAIEKEPVDSKEDLAEDTIEDEAEEGATEETEEGESEKPFYKESLAGIPHLEGQNLVQETGNILSYKIENTDMTVEEVTDYFIENTDNALWEIEKLESNDENSQQLIYSSKDEKVTTITQVGIIKSGDNMLISLTSRD